MSVTNRRDNISVLDQTLKKLNDTNIHRDVGLRKDKKRAR
jgi:hypothetical protein